MFLSHVPYMQKVINVTNSLEADKAKKNKTKKYSCCYQNVKHNITVHFAFSYYSIWLFSSS